MVCCLPCSAVDLELALTLAKRAGVMMKENIASRETKANSAFISKTNSVDVVTATDKACEKVILSGISAKYPDALFIAEESHTTGGE